MFKRGLTLLLTFAVLLFAFSTAAFADPGKNQGKNEIKAKVEFKGNEFQFQKEFKFKDVNNHWAVPEIRAMYMQGIISGYPDFTFKPESSVTKNEALLMICRAVGFDKDEYDTVDEWNNSPDWMRECIDFAVNDKNIINENEANNFKGNTPAKRYEVAIWAAKAAGLDSYTDINFEDLQDIPYFARPYIGSMFRCGYMIGYPGNVFQPNKPIKRAEIATLMFNMLGDFDGDINYRVVKGNVEDIDDETITVETKGNEETYDFTDDTEIFINRVSADWNDIEEGAKVVLYLNSDEVLYLYSREVDEDDDDDENEEELTVEKFVPADGKDDVNPSVDALKVTFNQDIKAVDDFEDIAKNIEIEADNGENVKIYSSIDEDDLKINGDTLSINVDLDNDTEYTVTIEEGVIRAEDSSNIKNEDINWEFTTEEEDNDEEILTVEKFTPADGKDDVDPSIDVLQVEFDQDIKAVEDYEDIAENIEIKADNAEVSIDENDIKINDDILSINVDLDNDTEYTVTIEEDVIRAEDSSNIKNEYIDWEFTTEEDN